MSGFWVPGGARGPQYEDNGAIVFEPGMPSPVGPYVVDSDRELPGKLVLGGWALYPDEWSQDGSPEAAELWARQLVAACAETAVQAEIQTRPRLGLTIVLNAAAPPPPEAIDHSCEVLKHYAEEEIGIPDELKCKTGSSTPKPLGSGMVHDAIRIINGTD